MSIELTVPLVIASVTDTMIWFVVAGTQVALEYVRWRMLTRLLATAGPGTTMIAGLTGGSVVQVWTAERQPAGPGPRREITRHGGVGDIGQF
jgi:hypothetical protein